MRFKRTHFSTGFFFTPSKRGGSCQIRLSTLHFPQPTARLLRSKGRGHKGTSTYFDRPASYGPANTWSLGVFRSRSRTLQTQMDSEALGGINKSLVLSGPVVEVPFDIGKPQLRPPQCDTRVAQEEKRRCLARCAKETEKWRALLNAEIRVHFSPQHLLLCHLGFNDSSLSSPCSESIV